MPVDGDATVQLSLLPVTALVVGWIVLEQQPSPLDLAGMLAVLAGVALQEREEIASTVPRPEPS